MVNNVLCTLDILASNPGCTYVQKVSPAKGLAGRYLPSELISTPKRGQQHHQQRADAGAQRISEPPAPVNRACVSHIPRYIGRDCVSKPPTKGAESQAPTRQPPHGEATFVSLPALKLSPKKSPPKSSVPIQPCAALVQGLPAIQPNRDVGASRVVGTSVVPGRDEWTRRAELSRRQRQQPPLNPGTIVVPWR